MGYGDLTILRELSLSVAEGELVVIVGHNGAGKTSLLRTISGLERVRSGEIRFCGERIDIRPVHEIAERRLIQVAEGRKLFPQMTVRENIDLGGYLVRKQAANQLDLVFELLPLLRSRLGQRVGTLSGGEQQMVALGRALMAQPKLLMLDEPSIGLSPLVAQQVLTAVDEIRRKTGVTILLVEQNVRLAMKIAKRTLVIERGEIASDGEVAHLLGDFDAGGRYLRGQARLKGGERGRCVHPEH